MTILSVSQVNMYLKSVFEELPPLQNVYISGEISNFKHYYKSGHLYFTLKDATSQLKCVMFSSDNYKLKFAPQDGMQVVCFGQIGVYERDGSYQLYVRDMQPKGIGELAISFEQLKQKLEKEGLFDEFYKKPIPKYPSKIGVATSNIGAAVEDIKNVISRRYPLCEIIIVPTVVQGDSAPNDISRSVKYLDTIGVDTIIVGRGGGSIEDLSAFNTEIVARTVFECKTPIISAVGHETDYTICDFVADVRAATPSVAAELAVPDIANELININNKLSTLDYLINRRIELEQNHINDIMQNSALSNMVNVIDRLYDNLEEYKASIYKSIMQYMTDKSHNISKLASMLNALSPLSVLSRGYSIVEKDSNVINDASNLSANDIVNIRMHNGSLSARVEEVNINE